MAYRDRVQQETSVTGTGSATLGTVTPGYRAVSEAYNVGERVPYVIEFGTEWEVGSGTLESTNVLARTTVLASSNAGSLVNFSTGGKKVFVTVPAADLNKMQTVDTIAFSNVIPFTAPGVRIMQQHNLSGALGFTVGSGAVVGASVWARVKGNGTITPTFAGFKQWDTSLDFTAGNGIVNIVQFFYDGTDYWYSIGVERNAQAEALPDTTAPALTSATGTATGTTTASGSVTTNEANGTLYSYISVNTAETVTTVKTSGTTQAVTTTGSKAVTATGLTPATQYYWHFVHRDTAGNDSTVVNSAGFTTTAADTTAPTLTSPTGSQTGTTTASGTVSTNEANGTLYYLASANAIENATTVKAAQSKAVTATGVQSVAFTGLTSGATYYVHYVHRDAANNDSTVSSSDPFQTAVSDTTAPALSNPTGSQTGSTTANGSVSTDEPNGTLYYVISANSEEAATTVKAGSSVAVSSTGTKNVSFAGLSASTTYYVHFLHRDLAGNDSTVASSGSFQTAAPADTTAPVLSSPTGTQTGATTASGTVTTDDATGTLYYLATTNATETVATVKAAASVAVASSGTKNVSFTGLTASTTYYAHYVHRDTAGNDSVVANSGSFTTSAEALTATRFSSMTAMTESGAEPWTYTGTGPSISTTPSGGIAQLALQPGQDGSLEVTVQETSGKPALGINTTGALQSYTSMPYFFYVDTAKYTVFSTGANQSASTLNNVVAADGDIIRLRRTGSTLVAEVSKNNRDTWTPIFQWTGVSTGLLRFQAMCPGAANLSVLKSPMGLGLA